MDKSLEIFAKSFPLVKYFKIGNKVFIYDAKANFAFSVSSDEFSIIYNILIDETYLTENKEIKVKLGYLKSNGVFLKGELEEVSPVSVEKIESTVKYFYENILLRKFCLEITQDCNFACKYCQSTLGTKHNSSDAMNMTFDVAKKSIDYYFSKYTEIFNKLSVDKKKTLLSIISPTLGWYGGEPFLNFKVLKESKKYFESLEWESFGIGLEKLKYTINSNMYVLTDEMMDFLVSNNITLYASLDGPQEENDKNRVLKKNGSGTFEVVNKNLEKLRNYNPAYFKSKVILLAVAALNHDLPGCYNFIKSEAGVHRDAADFWISDVNYKGCFVMNAEQRIKLLEDNSGKELQKFTEFISDENNKDKSFEGEMFDKMKHLIKFGKIKFENPQGSNKLNILLTCPAGIDNIMISPDGNFHICHKTDCSYPVGNCETGLDLEKVKDFLITYNKKVNEDACKSCWALHFCHFCSATRLTNGEFVNPGKSECDYTKKMYELYLNQFFLLSEYNENLFSQIAEYVDEPHKHISIIDINNFEKISDILSV